VSKQSIPSEKKNIDQQNRECIFHAYWKKEYQQQKLIVMSNLGVMKRRKHH
jgi:hypothetical protein